MNVAEWNALSPDEKRAQWPGLSILDRDAIIAADRRVLDEVIPLPESKVESAPGSPVVPLTPAPLTARDILRETRDNTAYPFLRVLIPVVAFVGYATCGVWLLVALVEGTKGVPNSEEAYYLIRAALGICVIPIFQHSAHLGLDLVDLPLHLEARRRAGK